MILFGLLAGVMVMLIRIYGRYPDGVMFGVLFANLFAPLLDMIKPKPFGAR
jgi:electron transport complex protein RnfD